MLEAVLEQADAAALCQLKAVSAAWCTHARRELCNRLCRREGNDITELDVKCLNDAGRHCGNENKQKGSSRKR